MTNQDDRERALDFFGRYYAFVLTSSEVPVVSAEAEQSRGQAS